jgi:hypothetical protein
MHVLCNTPKHASQTDYSWPAVLLLFDVNNQMLCTSLPTFHFHAANEENEIVFYVNIMSFVKHGFLNQ